MFWKEDWDRARENIVHWWNRRGPAVCVFAPKDKPWEDLPPPPPRPDDPAEARLDSHARAKRMEYEMSRTFFGGEAFPYFDTQLGPGSLGMILGAEPEFAPSTVWYRPCIEDPDAYPPIRFDPQKRWFRKHIELIEVGQKLSRGRFLVGVPDLIENIDTLAQMRDPQTLMMDMIERPEWIERCVGEINTAYAQVFDALYEKAKTPWGGNAFSAFYIWGPGKTAKLQCDASAMISPEMFDRLVAPGLAEQARHLDYVLYHLDGTHALPHLDTLLKIEGIHAIQWTPQAGIEQPGHPRWYEVYRKIKAAGKGVQALAAGPDEVIPLLDAVGAEGVFILARCRTEGEARRLLDRVEKYRPR